MKEIKENPTPQVSVLMAVHNGERFLKEAIDSILAQTYTDFEFIIVNDGSTDNSLAIIESYVDPRIILINNEKNIGLTRSLNKGLIVARAPYIARLDADDIALPERLEFQKNFLDIHKEIACVGSASIIINMDGEQVGKKTPPSNPELLAFFMILKNQITHSSVMFRKSIIMGHGGYNEQIEYTQDYELWSRLLLSGYRFSNIEQPLIKYRFQQSSITQGKSKDKAYKYSKNTVYKNISQYMLCDRKHFEIFIQCLHKHIVDSPYQVYIAQNVLRKIRKSYIKKESPSTDTIKAINQYVTRERIGALRWYAMRRLGIVYKPLSKIKHLLHAK